MGGILRIGCSGGEVQRLQQMLNKSLKPPPYLKIDGLFGPKTEAAVRHYQANMGLGIDGIVGTYTWGALEIGIVPPVMHPRPIATGYTDARWMLVAEKEVGQAQQPGGKHNPRIMEYFAFTEYKASTDEESWCSAFVNWCLIKAGVTGTNSAAAKDWMKWGGACGARVGAITVLHEFVPAAGRSGFHVGFLLDESITQVQLLGGNQSKRVKTSQYPRGSWEVVGHRWPKC